MKKSIKLLLFIFSVFMGFAIVSCGVELVKYSDKWSSDSTFHWHDSLDGSSKDKLIEHTFGDWKVLTPPTNDTKGSASRKCDVCNHEDIFELPVLTDKSYSILTEEATCTKEGKKTYTINEISFEIKLDKLDHHYETFDTVEEATCTQKGKISYECDICHEHFTEEISALGHNFKVTEVVKPTCEDAGYTIYKCERCKEIKNENSVEALGHIFIEVSRKEATETEEGYIDYRCERCGETKREILPIKSNKLLNLIYDGSYYDSITEDLLDSKNDLKDALNVLINTNYVRLSYAKAFDALDTIDSYDGGNFVECLYTGEKMDPANHGYWNREHVWAKSHGIIATSDKNEGDRNDAYSDLHHLRATENSINSTRNNRYFDEVDRNSSKTSHDNFGNYWTSAADVFEPRDEVKGDIARMLFYMTVKYDGHQKDCYLDLELYDDTATASHANKYDKTSTTNTGSLGKLSTLIKWSFEDPVDSREISRNEAIFKVQKNRNPFIDHPELVYYLYKTESEAQGITSDKIVSKVSPKYKNQEAIDNVNLLIDAIGSVNENSNDKINLAFEAYNELDSLSKSFVTKYRTLLQKKEEYRRLTTIQNIDVNTEFSFLTLKGSKEGELFDNGVLLNYKSTAGNAPSDTYGIYSQKDKNVTIKLSKVYNTVKKIKCDLDGSADEVTGKITVNDGTKTVEVSYTTGKKAVLGTLSIDVSSLDSSKEWTVVFNSGSSFRIRNLVLSID